MQSMLAPFVAMEGDGIAVHLVLDMSKDMEKFGIGFHSNDYGRETI